MTIAEVSELTGISTYTLRYYDKEGLLPNINRTESGIRNFNNNDMEILYIISCLKKSGMNIKKIKEFIDLCIIGDSTLNQRLEILIEQKKCIERQKKEIDKYMDKIDKKIECYTNTINAINHDI